MSKEKFAALAEVFAKVQQAERQNAYEQGLKQRRAGAGQKGKLPSSEAKLFFVLYYFKNYPTFAVLGTHFDIPHSGHRWDVQRRVRTCVS